MIKKKLEPFSDSLGLMGIMSKRVSQVLPSIMISGFAFGVPLFITDHLSILLSNFAGFGSMLVFTAWLWVEVAFANHLSVTTVRDRIWRVIFGVMIYGGLLLTLLEYAQEPLHLHPLITILGLVLSASGAITRYLSIRALGVYFTYELRVEAGQQIIQEGPYRYIRHPGYTGILLLLAGLPLIFQSWYGFFWLGLVCGSFMLIRIPHEETMLLDAFGETYRVYTKRTKRLIPFIY